MPKIPVILLCGSLALVSGCATTPPVDLRGADTSLTPGKAIVDIDNVRGRKIAWGGMIINTRNLKAATEIEVLGYPLDTSARPRTNERAQQRFLVVREGYLESADFRKGRLVTAVGKLSGTQHGRVGEAPYVYPVLRADQLYLWPQDENSRRNSNIQFGIGIGVILH